MTETDLSTHERSLEFLGWQCRIRQHAVRRDGGRPSSGMRPEVYAGERLGPLGRIVVLIVKQEWEESASRFRFMAEKTHDPADRYDAVLKYLQGNYYQKPETFSEAMPALFGTDSELAVRLAAEERCVLSFEQFGRGYRLPCAVRELGATEGAYQITYWHNLLFNPGMPGTVRVLEFLPDFSRVEVMPGRGSS